MVGFASDLDCLFTIVFFFDCVDCLFHVAQNEVAVTIVSLQSVSHEIEDREMQF